MGHALCFFHTRATPMWQRGPGPTRGLPQQPHSLGGKASRAWGWSPPLNPHFNHTGSVISFFKREIIRVERQSW